MVLSILLQLSYLGAQGGQLSPVTVSVLSQLGQLCADDTGVLVSCGVLGRLLADQLS